MAACECALHTAGNINTSQLCTTGNTNTSHIYSHVHPDTLAKIIAGPHCHNQTKKQVLKDRRRHLLDSSCVLNPFPRSTNIEYLWLRANSPIAVDKHASCNLKFLTSSRQPKETMHRPTSHVRYNELVSPPLSTKICFMT